MFRKIAMLAFVAMIDLICLDIPSHLSAREDIRLADSYAAWVSELDGSVGGDWSALLGEAKDLDASFRDRLSRMEAEVQSLVPNQQGGVQRVGNRLLRSEDVLLAVESLGDTSGRVDVALAWVEYSLMCERYGRRRAKMEAEQLNWREACRVFADYQAQIAARKEALRDLWALRTGRGRVVAAAGGTGSPQREATPAEALMFAMRRAQFAMSPLQIEAPRWTRVKDLWSRERLIELTKKQPQLQQLRGLIQSELRLLNDIHFEHVRRLSESGSPDERVAALGSLGWWSDHRGKKMILDGLQLPPEDARHNAALAALERLQLSAKDLAPLASHRQATVRLAVARLLRHRVGEGTEGLPILQHLSVDAHESVRRAAFEAADNLFNLGYATPVFQIRWGTRAIKSGDRETALDGIHFIEKRGQGLNPAARIALAQALAPSTRSSDAAIRDAALAAMPR